MCDDKGKYDNKQPHNPGCGNKRRIRKKKTVVEKSKKSDDAGSSHKKVTNEKKSCISRSCYISKEGILPIDGVY